jgi:hypothetical protein
MKLKIFVISFLIFLLAGYGFTQSKQHAFWLTKYYAKHKNNKKLESLIDMDLIKDSYEKTLIYQITLDYKDHHPNSQNYFPPVFAQYVKNKTQVSVTKEHVIDEIIEQLSKAKDFNYKNGEKDQVILSYKLDDYEEYLVYSKVNGDWKIISVNLPKISPVFQNRKIEIHGNTYGYIQGQKKIKEIRNNCMDKQCVLRWYQERLDFYNRVIFASSFGKLKDPMREKGTSQMMLIHNSNDLVCNEDYSYCSKEQFDDFYKFLQRQWDLTPEWLRISCGRYNTAGMMSSCIMGQTRAFMINFPQANVDWIYIPEQESGLGR